MKTFWKIFLGVLLNLILLSGCASNKQAATSTPIPPTPTARTILPTPSTRGDAVSWSNLQISMEQVELTDSFITEFGPQRIPSPGQRFLWVQVQVSNTGATEMDLPAAEHFSVLYAQSEFKPTYGHRQNYADYTALGSPLFPGQAIKAWLRFDLPEGATLNDLWFVFLPETAQVGVRPASPNYPYASNHPTYVWRCAP
jgi:hypothetical protein